MLPKVAAACDFARATGRPAMIGQLSDIDALVEGRAGTRISTGVHGVETTTASPSGESGTSKKDNKEE